MALKGKFIRKAKGDLKKAWRLQNAGKKKSTKKKAAKKKATKKSGKKKTVKKITTVKVVTKKSPKRGKVMAKKKTKTRRRRNGLLGPGTQKLVMDGVLIGGTTIGGTILLSQVPWLEKLKPWQKGLTLSAAGILIFMLVKGRFGKMLSLGAVSAGIMTAALPTVKEFVGISGGRRLTPGEMAAITAGNKNMGRPIEYMGKPAPRLSKVPVMGRAVNYKSMAGRMRRY